MRCFNLSSVVVCIPLILYFVQIEFQVHVQNACDLLYRLHAVQTKIVAWVPNLETFRVLNILHRGPY